MSLIEKNLAFLNAGSYLIHNLEKAVGESPVFFEDKAPFKLAFFKRNDKAYPLQSIRKPEDEAERVASHWLQGKTAEAGVFVLLGISSLHIISKVLELLNKNSELIILEPSSVILKSFLENNDLSELERQPVKLTFFNPQSDSPAREFRRLINKKDLFCKSTFITPSNKRFRPNLIEMQSDLAKQIQLEGMDRVTTAKYADEWLQNCLINLPEIARSPGIKSLYSKFPNTDCMVICAGPSLNESLDIIKEKQNDCFIIAVGTALKPLLKAGIKPNLTVVVDSDPKVYKQFQGLEQIPGYLLATQTIFPAIYQHFNKAFCFNCVVSSHYAEWLASSGIRHGFLNVGGTVALSAIDCAYSLNFRNTFIFGLDLAYAEDGTSHAKNSMYDGHKDNFRLIEIPGNWNKTVKTTKQFANYVEILKSYLREHIAGACGKFFNVNSSGARIEGLQVINPQDINKHFQSSAGNFVDVLDKEYAVQSNREVEELCLSSIEELKDFHKESLLLLEKVKSGQLPEELEEFEAKLKNSTVNNTLTGPAMQAWCMTVTTKFENDPVEMTKSFLTQLAGATEWVAGLLSNSYERFQKLNKGVQHGT